MAGGESPTPAGQPVLDIDSYLDPSVLDSSLLSFPGLRVEASAPLGALRGPGGGGRGCCPLWVAQSLRSSLRFSIGLCGTNEK